MNPLEPKIILERNRKFPSPITGDPTGIDTGDPRLDRDEKEFLSLLQPSEPGNLPPDDSGAAPDFSPLEKKSADPKMELGMKQAFIPQKESTLGSPSDIFVHQPIDKRETFQQAVGKPATDPHYIVKRDSLGTEHPTQQEATQQPSRQISERLHPKPTQQPVSQNFQKTQEDTDQLPDSVLPPSFGSGILSRFLSQPLPELFHPAVPETTRLKETMIEIASQVAERILVSDPSSSQPVEVRIQLKQEVLPDTEIRITHNDGNVDVEFVTMSPRSADIIGQGKPLLENMMQERLNTPVSVHITQTNADTDTGQGRARQEYIRDTENDDT